MRTKTIILLGAVLAGCSSPFEPDFPPVLHGRIVARDASISGVQAPTIHVKSGDSDECGVIFAVREHTPVRRILRDGSVRDASLADLTVGREVKVWADVVLDSCPAQSSANAVEIIEPLSRS